MTAFERWELPSFDATPVRAQVKAPPPPVFAPSVTAAMSAATVAAELADAQKLAREEGYAAGYQAGFSAGLMQSQSETSRIETLMGNLQIALTQIDEQLAQSLLDLSLEIARKMISETLHTRPEVIVKIVRSAISSLPHFNQNAHLILNPQDAELVRKQMGEELAHAGWKIFTDAKIEAGGCRLETAHSNIDATNAARWQNIIESIGRDKSWMMS